ncbi:MAG: hypothetical protein AB3N11_06780 [Arenibacterium sp.]
MGFAGRWFRRLLLLALVSVLALAAPVLYVETLCRPDYQTSDFIPTLPPEHHRLESRTLLTYPEWHIVHAYDDYAQVITTNDPHDFSYFRAISGYWSSLCALSQASGSMGGIDGETKQLVYVIGVSFTVEMALKALYEETLGRVATLSRGDTRSPLDDLSAAQARDYAAFLQQTPWYKWDFSSDIAALSAARTDALRDRERRLALGLEFGAKSLYAGVIANAVATVGPDELTLRMLVTGTVPNDLDGVTLIGRSGNVSELETPRYRALTTLIAEMAAQGVNFTEIAGNDDIMLTAISTQPALTGALMSLPRQGYDDYRHLLLVKVARLGDLLRAMDAENLRLEHIHDY